jgi:hypothetical protein
MPRNPNKKHCALPGCRAWAMRGRTYCASHRVYEKRGTTPGVWTATKEPEARAIRPPSDDHAPGEDHPLAALAAALQRGRERRHGNGPAGDDLQLIDRELGNLFAARAAVVCWIQKRDMGERTRVNPSQFLRAWNDSSSRVLALLRARAALSKEEHDGPFGQLLSRVYDELERGLPALDRTADADPAGGEGAEGSSAEGAA